MSDDAREALVSGLNEGQRRAVMHGDSPLLVLAGAGTGKTATLAHRVARLVADGADPSRILLLTYTRRAAAEMTRRVTSLVRGLDDASRRSGQLWAGTFHAVASRLLRMHADAVGLDPSFSILDRADSEDVMNVARTRLGLSKTDRRFPLKGTCVDAREPLDAVLKERFPWCREHAEDLRELFVAYTDAKQDSGALDYDDLLLFWHALLDHPLGGDAVRGRFDQVLVDEYQDTNALQADILAMLRPGGGGLTVVGDDAQAIYSFRAATVRNILDFPQRFPGAEIVTLDLNYRSTQGILTASDAVIALAEERHDKTLTAHRGDGVRPSLVSLGTEAEQSRWVAEQVLEHREGGIELKRQAVLFRASHHSMDLEVELARRDIPYRKYGGLKFAETAHVKDALAFLRLAENPRDFPAAARVLTLIPGVGPKKAEALTAALAEAEGDFEAAWRDIGRPPEAAAMWGPFVDLLAGLSASRGDLPSQMGAVVDFYTPLLEGRFDDADARRRDLEELAHLSARFTDRARFVAEISLDPPSWTEDLAGPPHLDDDWLVLSTMHSAKGLEWDCVYVIHAADGNIPSDMATGRRDDIDEERRLFYVALTRARDHLYVCHPLRYHVPHGLTDRHGYSQLTRFVPESVMPGFRRLDAGSMADGADGAERSDFALDVRARLKGMWA